MLAMATGVGNRLLTTCNAQLEREMIQRAVQAPTRAMG